MNHKPSRGDVWQVDMGIAGKVRPCLLLTDYPNEDELALVTVIPHTTALRGNSWEIAIDKPFLKPGAFHLQQVQSISLSKLMRRLGYLTAEEWEAVGVRLAMRLGLAF
jgi:mRNA interferase MazF